MDAFLDFAALVSFLEANKYPHAVNREAQLVELPSKAAPLPGNLLIKWEKKMPFFSLIQFMIDNVPDDRIHDVETAITRLNCNLEVPGLGFDHTTKRVYLRLVVPVIAPNGIPAGAFNQLGQGCVKQAQELYPGLKAVVDGRPGDQILTFAAELARASKTPEGGALA